MKKMLLLGILLIIPGLLFAENPKPYLDKKTVIIIRDNINAISGEFDSIAVLYPAFHAEVRELISLSDTDPLEKLKTLDIPGEILLMLKKYGLGEQGLIQIYVFVYGMILAAIEMEFDDFGEADDVDEELLLWMSVNGFFATIKNKIIHPADYALVKNAMNDYSF